LGERGDGFAVEQQHQPARRPLSGRDRCVSHCSTS
jgi:hypothetical protein